MPDDLTFRRDQEPSLNIFGEPLVTCSCDPVTGFWRDGACHTGPEDSGRHTVCAVMNDASLDFSASRGNDLRTPRPEYDFPGLIAGERWCVCALRWKEADEAGVAPDVILEATHKKTLEVISRDRLFAKQWDDIPF